MSDDKVTVAKGEWFRDEAGQYRFRVLATNGEILAWGESYARKEDCLAALKALLWGNGPIVEGTAQR